MNPTLAVSAVLLISHVDSASQIAIQTQGAPEETACSNELSDVERIAQSRLLIESDWRMFRHVATLRSAKGLEVLPDMLGCPSLSTATSQWDADAETAAMLARYGYSSRDYVEVAWAVLLANDPEGFGVTPNSKVAANMSFLAHRHSDVQALLQPK